MSANASDKDEMRDFEIFNIGDAVNVVAYSVMAIGMSNVGLYHTATLIKPILFIVGMILNSMVLYMAGRKALRTQRYFDLHFL